MAESADRPSVAIGSDHAGFALKQHLVAHLRERGHDVVDVGTDSEASTDYPWFCIEVGRLVTAGTVERGIVLGGSGQGEQIAANKVPGVRCALCPDVRTAELSRAHNDANVLAMGGRVVAFALAEDIVQRWLATGFDGGRHQSRLDQIAHYERTGDLDAPNQDDSIDGTTERGGNGQDRLPAGTTVGATVGFLHPGAMGSAMAASCRGSTIWASDRRSEASRERAATAGLSDVDTVEHLAARADIIISICPPAAAETVARTVAETGYDRLYVDANAVSPATSQAIAAHFGDYVDASIVGPPPTREGASRLFLSGPSAGRVAELWSQTALEPVVIGDTPTSASALKMAYAGWTKGSTALLLAVHGLARHHGVADVLHHEWSRSQAGLVERLEGSAPAVGAKAWRFSGEMAEIADSLAAADLPDGFHRAAEELYQRIGGDEPPPIDADNSLDALIDRLAAHDR